MAKIPEFLLPGVAIRQEKLLLGMGLRGKGHPLYQEPNPGIVAALSKCLLPQPKSEEKTDKVQS